MSELTFDNILEHTDLINHTQVGAALMMILTYGNIDGAHHKQWVLDQVVRLLTGENYQRVIAAVKAGEDGPDTYDWDTGIAP